MCALMRIVVFIMLSVGVLFAQNGFVYTNDDSFSAPNTVSLMAIQGDGSLTTVQSFNTGGMGNGGNGSLAAQRVIVSPDNRFVFASNAGSNDISGFSIDATTGNLSLIAGSPFSTGGNGCQGIAVATTPDVSFLFAANTCSDNISVFKIGSGGSLSLLGTPISTGTSPIDLKVTKNGKFLMATLFSLSGGLIDVFSIGNNGSLAPVPGSPFSDNSPPGAVSTSLDTNCASNLLFVDSESALPAIDVFNINATGSLTQIANSPFAAPGNSVTAIFLSPDEEFLYAANQQNSVTSFAVASDGSLSVVAGTPVASTGTPFLGGLATDSTGRFLYVAGFYNDIAAYTVDTQGGLTLEAGSPFHTSGFGGFESLATLPSKTCGAKTGTSTILTSNLNPSVYGQKVSFTATVANNNGSVPTGRVSFTWGIYTIGSATLNASGVATLTLSTLNADTFPLTAVYKGDANNLGSTSPVVSQIVSQASSSATLASSTNPSSVGEAVTFSARISSPTARPSGLVTFTAGKTALGTVELANGKATVTTSSLPAGSNSVTVTFSGDSDVQGSFASVTQVVQ